MARDNAIRSVEIRVDYDFRVSILGHVRGIAILPEDASNIQFVLCFPDWQDLKRFLDQARIIYDEEMRRP